MAYTHIICKYTTFLHFFIVKTIDYNLLDKHKYITIQLYHNFISKETFYFRVTLFSTNIIIILRFVVARLEIMASVFPTDSLEYYITYRYHYTTFESRNVYKYTIK